MTRHDKDREGRYVEKYGRYLADVYMGPEEMEPQDVLKEGILLNQLLLDRGLAKKYGE